MLARTRSLCLNFPAPPGTKPVPAYYQSPMAIKDHRKEGRASQPAKAFVSKDPRLPRKEPLWGKLLL